MTQDDEDEIDDMPDTSATMPELVTREMVRILEKMPAEAISDEERAASLTLWRGRLEAFRKK